MIKRINVTRKVDIDMDKCLKYCYLEYCHEFYKCLMVKKEVEELRSHYNHHGLDNISKLC